MPCATWRARAPEFVKPRPQRAALPRGAPRRPHRDRRGRAARRSLLCRPPPAPRRRAPRRGSSRTDLAALRSRPRAPAPLRGASSHPPRPGDQTTCRPFRRLVPCFAEPERSSSLPINGVRKSSSGGSSRPPIAARASSTISPAVRSARRSPWREPWRRQARVRDEPATGAAAPPRARRALPSICGPRTAACPTGTRRARTRASRGRPSLSRPRPRSAPGRCRRPCPRDAPAHSSWPRLWASSEAEVGEVTVLPAVFLGDENVRRLHVTVDEPARMRGIQSRSDLADERERPHVDREARRELAACASPSPRRSAWRCRDGRPPLPRRRRERHSSDRGWRPAATQRGSARGSVRPVPARARSA